MESTKSRILNAALLEFGERGYYKTTMDHLAEKAGVAKGTLYWNFKSKETLLLAVIDRQYEKFGEMAAKNLSFESPSPDMIAKALNFKDWLDKKSLQTPPKGLLGKAVNYTLGQWDSLIRYINNGWLRPDNNLLENNIRPFVVGRKNWLFSGHPRGAEASAALYSLVITARENGLEPYHYLRFIFEKLPFANSQEDYRKLLPQNVDRKLLRIPRVG